MVANHGERGRGGGGSMGGKKKNRAAKLCRVISKKKREKRVQPLRTRAAAAPPQLCTPHLGATTATPPVPPLTGPDSCTDRARWLPTPPEHTWLISAPDRGKKKRKEKKRKRR